VRLPDDFAAAFEIGYEFVSVNCQMKHRMSQHEPEQFDTCAFSV